MWAMTSRVSHPVQAVARVQAPGSSAIANIRSASARTTRRMVSLPSYDMAFHSLMSMISFDRTELCWSGPTDCGALSVLLVELVSGEVHERIAEQLDLDAVRVLEVHRLGDALVWTEVRDPGRVELGPQVLPAVARYGDRDVLDRPDRLDAWVQAQAREVEEAQQGLVAQIEEEVGRALIVPVLDQLHQ